MKNSLIEFEKLEINLNDFVIHKKSENHYLILNMNNEDKNLYEIKGSSTMIFDFYYSKLKSLDNIIENMMNKFKITEEQLSSDVHHFINDLKKNKILIKREE